MAKNLDEGLKLLRLGQPYEALQRFNAALDERDRPLEALLGAARASSWLGHLSAARQLLTQALLLAPGQRRIEAEIAAIDALKGDAIALEKLESLAEDGGPGVQVLFGEVLVAQGKIPRAEKVFAQAAEKSPDNPELLLELGRIALTRREWKTAIGHFHRAVELLPNFALPLLLEGRALAASGQVPQAIANLERARGLAPQEPAVPRELFKLKLVAEDFEGAIAIARALAALEPGRGEPLYLEAVVLLLTSDADGAEAKLREAIALEAGLWQAHQALAKIWLMRGKRDQAQQRLEAVVAEHPTEPGPANDLAVLYLEGPDASVKVEKLLKPVIAAHPSDPATAMNLAIALKDRDKIEAKRLARIAAESQAAFAGEAKRLMDSIQVSGLMVSRLGSPIRAD